MTLLNSIDIFILSYKRCGNVITHKLFKEDDYKFIVRESEYESYNKLYNNVITIPDSCDSLSKTRNYVLNLSKKNNVLMLDDDINMFCKIKDYHYSILNYEDIILLINNMFTIINDLNLSLWTVKITNDVRQYKQDFLFKSIIGGCLGISGRKFRFDENLKFKVDNDYQLQILLKERVIFINSAYAINQKRDLNKGGSSSDRNTNGINKDIEYLKMKWGKYIDFDYKKNLLKINVKR